MSNRAVRKWRFVDTNTLAQMKEELPGVKGRETRSLHAVVTMQVYSMLIHTLLRKVTSVLRSAQWRVFPSSDQLLRR